MLKRSVLVAASLLLFFTGASGRDRDGRYAQSPLKEWFDGLRSGRGPCCSDADGSALQDSDWEVKDGKYRVRIPLLGYINPGQEQTYGWVDVPDDAVLTVPNKYGRTMVWPIYGMSGVSIRCFIPGAGI